MMEFNDQTLPMIATYSILAAFVTYVVMIFKGLRDKENIYKECDSRKKEERLEKKLDELERRLFKLEINR